MVEFRLETDSIGEKEVPQDAYYGVQSLRGNENFNITGELLHKKMIKALAIVKKACAISNFKAKVMDKEVRFLSEKGKRELRKELGMIFMGLKNRKHLMNLKSLFQHLI